MRNARGFTLVEILVVVIVLGILAAIIVPNVSSGRTDARMGARETQMREVEKALEMYNNDNGVYPSTSNAWWGDCPSYGGRPYSGPTGYIPDLAPDYMAQLPRDPNPAYPVADRGYLYRSNGTDFKFLAYRTPERFSANHPLYDPARPTTAWQISTTGAVNW
ncbi:MAG TPA: prepilin-type N-terminal cleavage/methylation domain-containing protein [Phycisphaerales bacterium]|nr:prepilin-type N-terminal cleavage/methylation domain-containing protein [Phycisphaerales bacterium]